MLVLIGHNTQPAWSKGEYYIPLYEKLNGALKLKEKDTPCKFIAYFWKRLVEDRPNGFVHAIGGRSGSFDIICFMGGQGLCWLETDEGSPLFQRVVRMSSEEDRKLMDVCHLKDVKDKNDLDKFRKHLKIFDKNDKTNQESTALEKPLVAQPASGHALSFLESIKQQDIYHKEQKSESPVTPLPNS